MAGESLPVLHSPNVGITYYVDAATGNDSNAGTSTGAAWATIQGAFNNLANTVANWPASTDVRLYIRAGTYQASSGSLATGDMAFTNANRQPNSSRWLLIERYPGDARPKIIPPGGSTGAKYGFRTGGYSYIQMRGLEFDGESTRRGDNNVMGIYLSGSPAGPVEVVDCWIHGMYANGPNAAGHIAQGMYIDANSNIREHKITQCRIWDIGTLTDTIPNQEHGVYSGAYGTKIYGNVFWDIRNGFGVQIYSGAAITDVLIASNTIVDTAKSSIIVPRHGSNIRITNNILVGGQYGIEFYPTSQTGSGNVIDRVVYYNHDSGNKSHASSTGWTITNELTSDPLFVNRATGDLHLTGSSPARGYTASAYSTAVDIDGVTRDGSPDAGAYEYASAPTPISLTPATATAAAQVLGPQTSAVFGCSLATTAQSTTAQTSFAFDAGVSFSVGDYVVIGVAADNAGASGVASLTGITDAAGNTYQLIGRSLIVPTASPNTGTDMSAWIAEVTSPLTATDDITLTFSTSTTAKTATVWKVTGQDVRAMARYTATGSAGSAAVTASARDGELVIGFVGVEMNAAVTADADTTNGSWSTAGTNTANTGSGGSSQRISSQYKMVTADSLQTYDPTFSSGPDAAAIVVVLAEQAPIPLSGLTVWCEADRVPAASGAVASWLNMGSTGVDATQATGAAQPTLAPGQFPSARAGLQFDGTNDVMDIATSMANIITNTAFTAISVFIPRSFGTNNATIYNNDCVWVAADSNVGFALRSAGGGQASPWNWSAGGQVVDHTIVEDAPVIHMARHASGNLYAAINGGTESSIASGNTAGLGASLIIGRNAGGAQFTDMVLGALLIWNRSLSSGEIAGVVDYLDRVWIEEAVGAPDPVTVNLTAATAASTAVAFTVESFAGEPALISYISYTDQARGKTAVLAHTDTIDEIAPSWWAPAIAADGSIVLQQPPTTVEDTGLVDDFQAAGGKVAGVIANYYGGGGAGWQWSAVTTILNDVDLRATHVTAIVDLAVTKGYDSIDLDYEHGNGTDRAVFTTFVGQLADGLHAVGKKLSVVVHPKQIEPGGDAKKQTQDWRGIVAAGADQVRVMLYDYDPDAGPAPQSPISWWRQVARWAIAQVPANKLVLGAPLYGYDWRTDNNNYVDRMWDEMEALATTWSQTPTTDTEQEQTFQYGPIPRRVYYLNAANLAERAKVVRAHRFAGMHVWRAGGEDPTAWDAIEAALENDSGTFEAQLEPVADVMLDAADTDKHDGVGDLQVKASLERRSLFHFDVSFLPDDAVITNAELRLVRTGFSGTEPGGRTYQLMRMTTTDWVETADGNPATDGATWVDKDVGTAWTSAGGDFTATGAVTGTVPGSNGSAMTFTTGLAALVEDARDNRDGQLVLLLKDSVNTGNHATVFAGREDATANNRPRLTLTYTMANVPQTINLSPAVAASSALALGLAQGSTSRTMVVAQALATAQGVVGVGGPLTRTLSTATAAAAAQALAVVPGARTISMTPAVATAAAQTMQLAGGAATVNLTAATAAAGAQALQLAPGSTSRTVAVASAASSAVALTAQAGQAAVTLVPAQALAFTVALIPGAGILLQPAVAPATAQPLTVTSGPVSRALAPAGASAVTGTVAVQAGAVSLPVAPGGAVAQAMALSVIRTEFIGLVPAVATAAARALQVIGAGLIPLVPAEASSTARPLGLAPGAATIALSPAVAASSARPLALSTITTIAVVPAEATSGAVALSVTSGAALVALAPANASAVATGVFAVAGPLTRELVAAVAVAAPQALAIVVGPGTVPMVQAQAVAAAQRLGAVAPGIIVYATVQFRYDKARARLRLPTG